MQSWDKMIVLCTLVGNICSKDKMAWMLMLNCHCNTTDRQGHSVYQQDKNEGLVHAHEFSARLNVRQQFSVFDETARLYI